jgi:ATP-dependent protease HslVU (ClpYQ) peptidase subunit
MTTIAYRDGVLAADTQVTCGGTVDGWTRKAFRKGRLLYAVSGGTGLANAFRSWVEGGMIGEAPSLKGADDDKDSAHGFLFPGGNRVVWRYNDVWTSHKAPFFAAGSGSEIALGAMLAGATAEQAVRAAAERDTSTGGEITVLHLEPRT